MKNPKLFSFRRLALPVAAAMLVALWPVLPAAAADGGPTQIHVNKPTAMAVDPTTNQIYVVSADDNTLTAIDGATHTPPTPSPGSFPSAPTRVVAVDPATGKIYVACYGGGPGGFERGQRVHVDPGCRGGPRWPWLSIRPPTRSTLSMRAAAI